MSPQSLYIHKSIWLIGLPGTGKTTLGKLLVQELKKRGIATILLDGDEVRTGLNNDLGFSTSDRLENIRRVAEISKIILKNGVSTVNAFITPTEELRTLVRSIIPPDSLIEVFLDAPLHICEMRDPKGMYRKAREGRIKNFTGLGSAFEPPLHPDLIIKTGELNIEESLEKLLLLIIEKQARSI